MQPSTGLSSFNDLAKSLREMNKVSLSLIGIRGICEVVEEIKKNMTELNEVAEFNNIAKHLAVLNIPTGAQAFEKLSKDLQQIAEINQKLAVDLSDFANSQVLMTNNLAAIMKKVKLPRQVQLNALSLSLQRISSTFLREVYISEDWADFEAVIEANEAISTVIKDVIIKKDEITKFEIDSLPETVVTETSKNLPKPVSGRVRQYILDAMAIIGFFINIYLLYVNHTDKGDSEAIKNLTDKIEELNNLLKEHINNESQKSIYDRIATADVNLRIAPNKNSKITSIVKKGQIVTVIEFRTKYLGISYIDYETDDLKSGFVVKEYFTTFE